MRAFSGPAHRLSAASPHAGDAIRNCAGRLRGDARAHLLWSWPTVAAQAGPGPNVNIDPLKREDLPVELRGLEPLTPCLQSKAEASLSVSWRGSECLPPADISAECGWVSPDTWRHWLPTWLPETQLTPVDFLYPQPCSRLVQARPAMPGQTGCLAARSTARQAAPPRTAAAAAYASLATSVLPLCYRYSHGCTEEALDLDAPRARHPDSRRCRASGDELQRMAGRHSPQGIHHPGRPGCRQPVRGR